MQTRHSVGYRPYILDDKGNYESVRIPEDEFDWGWASPPPSPSSFHVKSLMVKGIGEILAQYDQIGWA